MKIFKLISVFTGILFLVILSSFLKYKTSKQEGKNNKRIQVSASFYPLYFFTSEIGGNRVDVKNITPAGSEPHDFEPTTRDIVRIEKSRMLVLNGNIEAWGDKIKENLKGTNVEIIVAGEGLFTKQQTEEGKTSIDPHIWLSPQLAKKEASKITAGLIKIDSANSLYYKNNEKVIDEKLDKLDKEYRQRLSVCKRKDIIASHAAFGYLVFEYGLNQVSISGLSPESEPSSKQLVEIVKFAREHNVKYIFFERLVSPKLSETIAREIGARTLVLDPLEGITDDEIKRGKNYFSVMRDNLKNLETALECAK
ncbi:MAG: ABC-type metal ion transporter, periplasmic subunit [Candidatus Gottesmanbacteria bacterium GW2011_GWC2_39_8]|uniref:ABC-type metal ion transporter, periplasmic subunit n=1 Tax=Candidatus Gottesmanbacteria bacterium GW2011_GWC2_39_8 TaxID=1618450 RepID=A0A0G0T6F0_9BACT|nr:MAG: ABC-type metal ion transporter, periplasmic subunit [Candidatus Gottesmanbacteria bacterium GW2011_GWC2_39_8]